MKLTSPPFGGLFCFMKRMTQVYSTSYRGSHEAKSFPTSARLSLDTILRLNSAQQMKKLQLSKFDASGNTFIVCRAVGRSAPEGDKTRYGKLARALCSASTGFAADGLVVIASSKHADFRMDVFNADGSWAERSGNGLRSAVAFMSMQSRKKKWRIECFQEITPAEILATNGAKQKIGASIGVPAPPGVGLRRQIKVGMRNITYSPVSVGNPHAVVQVRNFPGDWQALAVGLSDSGAFPDGVNVEFVKVINRKNIEALVFERGVGVTASSGTGAAACVVALRRLELLDSVVKVKFPAHSLRVKWPSEGAPVYVTGDVIELFRGEAAI